MPRSTRAARTIDIDVHRQLEAESADRRLHPGYGAALRRLPAGRQVFRGLPFDFGPRDGPRWIVLDRPITIDLRGAGRASHVVIAHLCDSSRTAAGERPTGMPVGHMVPIGEPLAAYTIEDGAGHTWRRRIRRRFEIGDGIVGWGSAPFAAVGHLDNEVIDWRGPHAYQTPGRYAPAGQSGSLTIMPGTYGGNQVGMTDLIPSPTDDVMVWLHAIPLERGARPTALRLEPLAADRPGGAVVVVAVTTFDGSADPLVRSPRFEIGVRGLDGRSLGVDLGTVIRSRPAPWAGAPVGSAGAGVEDLAEAAPVIGWGSPRPTVDAGRGERLVDLSVAPDAVLDVAGWTVRGAALVEGATLRDPSGRRSIQVLPAARIPVEVVVRDAAGDPIPARVRFVAADGRYLAPDNHRDEVNPGFFEDTGADLVLGGSTYAYVPGAFSIRLPAGRLEVEAMAGFDRPPVRRSVTIEPSTRRLELAFEAPIELAGGDRWLKADSHVHFLAPSTATLQAAAEGLDLVNLLAAQWGDLFTSVADIPWGSMTAPGGRPRVVVGTENRQNMLGHLALLGASRPTLPLASGGPPEGRMAGALEVLLADWADRCHAAGGLVVGAHFPLPYAEIAADIVAGKIDALEAQALSPGLDDPTIVEWYRFLNLGDRLPIVAGTDKMSAEVPVGAVRTYTHLLGDAPPSFDAWAAAVRAGRTFISSGPILELAVEGREPGDVVAMASPGRIAVEARVRATQPVVHALEIVVNGRVVAATAAAGRGARELVLREAVPIEAGSWIAARSRSRDEIQSAFTSSMAAHTSPVYVEVAGRPLVPAPADVDAVEQVILGARTWIADLAAVARPADRERMLALLDASMAALRARLPS